MHAFQNLFHTKLKKEDVPLYPSRFMTLTLSKSSATSGL